MYKILPRVFLLSFLILMPFKTFSCPSSQIIEKDLKRIFPRIKNLKVEKIEKASISGLCAVILKTKSPFKNIIYVDQKGKFIFLGQLINLKTGENLTRKLIIEHSKLSPEQIKKLEDLIAFKEGNSKKEIFLITDPDCPFCKRMEKTLLELINEGKLTVKVIFMPLERLHPKAKEKAIAIICDKKGFGELLTGYISSNQCEIGKKKVELAQKFLFNLGIKGTPIVILQDGRLVQGALPKTQLEKLLGLIP